MSDLSVYGGLFLSAFLAATLLPAQSELVLASLLASESRSAAVLILVASFGNVLGALFNYWIGRGANALQGKRWFPIGAEALARAEGWYHRYGRWSLLLSWAPVVGDPLTLAAGVLRENIWVFLTLVTLAKTGRYLVVGALVWGWL
ncbi:YqaA family protein [Lentibacter sp. XHP0401]|jgi:membrane protein YqaA with SNARE-associated domain|uniref:YqaA family protein n=1 Tax=Lentibacter sp. XHP0401 TaxID=2984334 RepID=UPI0021E7029C|nr:YqaA family protein [Lentibacter sp. XHP0401]MCV2893356.1 DedA family protein [Lentibacter sp. XHP0401]